MALEAPEDEPGRRERREWPRRQASTRREQRDAGRAAHPEETPTRPQEIEDEHAAVEARHLVHAERGDAEFRRQHDGERPHRAPPPAPSALRRGDDEGREEEAAREHDRRRQVGPGEDGEARVHDPFTVNVKWPSVACVSTDTTDQLTV